jgi:hypothetical protein
MNGVDERTGRDGRLLALVIVVSLAVLLLLARFRFPATDGVAPAPAPGPLERLTARSTYDDLAATIANIVQRARSTVAVLQLNPISEPEKPSPKSRQAEPIVVRPPRLVPALRVGQDLAVLHLPAGFQVTTGQGLSAPIEVVASDPRRELVVVRAPSVFEMANGLTNAADTFAGFSYVAVVEATSGGLTAEPVFVGRTDPRKDSHWATDVLGLSGSSQISPGGLVFGLDGRVIGLVFPGDGGERVLIPAAAIETAVAALTGGKGGSP